MSVIPMKALLEAGVHFGHQTRRWNPKMAKYIYTSRNGIHIIDLQKTSECIDIAYQALFDIVEQGGHVLFVGTKKQSQDPVREEATRTGQYYVNKRWLGGTLTNFKTIKRSIKKLHDLHKMEEDGIFAVLPKKEVINLRKEMDRLEKFLGGIKEMKSLPQALFIIDPRKERNAILEARKLGIPVFGIIDTNCDPDEVDYIIPANDDALRSIKLIVGKMGDAIIEASGGVVESDAESEDTELDIEAFEDEETLGETPKVKSIKVEVKPKAKEKEATEEEIKDAAPEGQKRKPKPATKIVKLVVDEDQVEKVEAVVPAETETKKPKAQKVLKEPVTVEDYEELTVPVLRQIAKDLGVVGYTTFKKAGLIEEIIKAKK